jgi:hypothetical protein
MAGRRPTQLTKELIELFSQLLPIVPYLETAGDLLRVPRWTWIAWIKNAHRVDKLAEQNEHLPEHQQHVFTPHDDLCVDFLREYRRGRAIFFANCLRKIQDHPSWRAQAWILERRFPEQWGKDRLVYKQIERQIKELEAMMQALQPQAPRLHEPSRDEQKAAAGRVA